MVLPSPSRRLNKLTLTANIQTESLIEASGSSMLRSLFGSQCCSIEILHADQPPLSLWLQFSCVVQATTRSFFCLCPCFYSYKEGLLRLNDIKICLEREKKCSKAGIIWNLIHPFKNEGKCGTQDIKGISAAIKEQIYGKSAQVVFLEGTACAQGIVGLSDPRHWSSE